MSQTLNDDAQLNLGYSLNILQVCRSMWQHVLCLRRHHRACGLDKWQHAQQATQAGVVCAEHAGCRAGGVSCTGRSNRPDSTASTVCMALCIIIT